MISILSVFPPFRGGISTFSDFLYKHLNRQTEVTAYNFSHLYPSILFPGKSQFSEGMEEPNYAEPVLHSTNPLNWKAAAKQVLRSNPEHLVVCYWHPFFAPAYLKVIKTARRINPDIKIHILAHNVVPHEHFPFGHLLSRKLFNSADQLIVLSQKSFDEAKKLEIESDIKKLFHPVYEQEYPAENKSKIRQRYGVSPEENVFLFFGLVRPYKGLDTFIAAMNQLDLKKYQIKPVIAGEFYSDKERLLSMINPDHREFYLIEDRFVSDDEMAEIFTLSDVLVMPYKSASQSGILANAINFNLPVIVSDLKGLTEHLEHNKSALIVEKEDISELKEAIFKLIDPTMRKALKRALEPLKKELSWNSFTQRFLNEISKENQ